MTKINYVFLGHHKVATRYVIAILNGLCAQIGLQSAEYASQKRLEDNISNNSNAFLYYTNANKNVFLNNIENATTVKGFHLIRDPRDIVISSYFSHLYSHSTSNWEALIDHRKKLEALNKKDGIIAEMDFRMQEMADLNSWTNDETENIATFRLEDIMISPYKVWLQIMNHLELIEDKSFNLRSINHLSKLLLNEFKERIVKKKSGNDNNKISPHFLLSLVYMNRFEAKSKGRKMGEESVKSHYRKGVAGDWINHFDDELLDIFKSKYNNVLLNMGYEKNENWEDKYKIKVTY